MNHRYMVSLEVCSDSLTLADLSLKLGRPPGKTSHDKDQARYNNERFGTTIWQLESNLSEDTPIEKHLENLTVHFQPKEFLQRLPEGCAAYLNIGVLYDTRKILAVGLVLPPEAVEIVNAYRAYLEITCYPTELTDE